MDRWRCDQRGAANRADSEKGIGSALSEDQTKLTTEEVTSDDYQQSEVASALENFLGDIEGNQGVEGKEKASGSKERVSNRLGNTESRVVQSQIRARDIEAEQKVAQSDLGNLEERKSGGGAEGLEPEYPPSSSIVK